MQDRGAAFAAFNTSKSIRHREGDALQNGIGQCTGIVLRPQTVEFRRCVRVVMRRSLSREVGQKDGCGLATCRIRSKDFCLFDQTGDIATMTR